MHPPELLEGHAQGRSQEFAKEWDRRGVWGTEVSSGIQGQSPGAWRSEV